MGLVSSVQEGYVSECMRRKSCTYEAHECALPQLEEQVSAQQALEEEHAAVKEALESAVSGIGKLTSRCSDLESELAETDQVSSVSTWTGN